MHKVCLSNVLFIFFPCASYYHAGFGTFSLNPYTILTFMNIKRNCFSSLIFSMSTFHIHKIGFNRESSQIADAFEFAWKEGRIGLVCWGLKHQPGSYRGGGCDNDDMSVSLVEEIGVPGGNHRPRK